jgi:uncharacterized protein YbcC (UPF0753/DUF2309 family)
MRKITSQEIRALKAIIKSQRDTIMMLEAENNDLMSQLLESKAKEGKGCLENAVDAISQVISAVADSLSGELTSDELASQLREYVDDDSTLFIDEEGDT